MGVWNHEKMKTLKKIEIANFLQRRASDFIFRPATPPSSSPPQAPPTTSGFPEATPPSSPSIAELAAAAAAINTLRFARGVSGAIVIRTTIECVLNFSGHYTMVSCYLTWL